VQKYRLHEGQTPSAAFQKWIDEIESGVRDKLLPALKASDMLMSEVVYESIDIPIGKPLLQMSDFNSLIALSQKHKVPVFALSDAQLGQTGVVLGRTKKSMKKFEELFSNAAEKIIALTSYEKDH
jgi:hypothetical protein